MVVAVLVLGLAGLGPAWAATVALGTARGGQQVELSLDDGQTWWPLRGRAFPVLDHVRVRSGSGGAALDLTDGSRLQLLPFSALRVRAAAGVTELGLQYGRMGFRLPVQTRVELQTRVAQLRPVRTKLMVGEVFATGDGTMGVRMTQGSLEVNELTGAQRVLLASLEPVFLPKRPAGRGPLFGVEATPPVVGVRAIFTPKGESLGYLGPNARLVVRPGYTADMTQGFPAKLVQLAMAGIPEKDRSDAVPLFDVNGGYVGYVAGPVFVAQAQLGAVVAQVVGGEPPAEAGAGFGWGWASGIGALVGGVIGGVIVDQTGGECNCEVSDGVVATALRPVR